MANTFTQIHLQFVFVVKHRQAMIHSSWKEELYKYITSIIQSNSHKLLAINGMPDHLHILVGLRPTQSISDLMQEVKRSSSKWINERKFTPHKFEWQEGYGAFSYSASQVPQVNNYIRNQEDHHSRIPFSVEYKELLNQFEIEYDERFLFKDPM